MLVNCVIGEAEADTELDKLKQGFSRTGAAAIVKYFVIRRAGRRGCELLGRAKGLGKIRSSQIIKSRDGSSPRKE
jgi:hypothetical protein